MSVLLRNTTYSFAVVVDFVAAIVVVVSVAIVEHLIIPVSKLVQR